MDPSSRHGWNIVTCDRRMNAWYAGCRLLATSQTPPANIARGATADLCDVHYPDPVDKVVVSKIQIMQPIFRSVTQQRLEVGVRSSNVPHVGCRAHCAFEMTSRPCSSVLAFDRSPCICAKNVLLEIGAESTADLLQYFDWVVRTVIC